MSGSTLEAMAKAVEGSAVVLICVSKKYKESQVRRFFVCGIIKLRDPRSLCGYPLPRRVPTVVCVLSSRSNIVKL